MPSSRAGFKNGFSTMRMSARFALSITAALGSPVMRIAGVDIRRSRNFAIRSRLRMANVAVRSGNREIVTLLGVVGARAMLWRSAKSRRRAR